MFSKIVKVVAISSIFVTGSAHADFWNGYAGYPQMGGYAPVVQEQVIMTPRGVVEEEVIVVPERIVEYRQIEPRYNVPVQNYYGYAQPAPIYMHRDWDDR
jgi:hypothetical protein